MYISIGLLFASAKLIIALKFSISFVGVIISIAGIRTGVCTISCIGRGSGVVAIGAILSASIGTYWLLYLIINCVIDLNSIVGLYIHIFIPDRSLNVPVSLFACPV